MKQRIGFCALLRIMMVNKLKASKYLFIGIVIGTLIVFFACPQINVEIRSEHISQKLIVTTVTANVSREMKKGNITALSPTKQTAGNSKVISSNKAASVKEWNNPDQNIAYFKARPHRITPLDFKFLIDGKTVCESEKATFLLIMVLSLPSHIDYRDAIRETWGRLAKGQKWPHKNTIKHVKVIFLFGDSGNKTENTYLQKEALETKDIVQIGFKEAYFNLTYKVLMGFKWVKSFCPKASYVMKADEDSFIDVPTIVSRLHQSEWNTKICGPYFIGQKRYSGGKFHVDPKVYPFKIYPPHVKGNIYFMPRDIAEKLLNVSEYMPYVNMEDVHVTGILAKVIGAKHKAIGGEYNAGGSPAVCDFAQGKKIAGQHVSPSFARKIWKRIENTSLCKTR